MTDLIKLQKCYIRQSLDVKENAWVVFSEENEELHELDAALTPKAAMSYVHFGRKFELEAFNVGITFGKSEERKIALKVIAELKAKLEFIEQQNMLLSTKLEQFIIGEES